MMAPMNIWMGLLFVGLLILFTGGMIHLVMKGRTGQSQDD